MPVEARAGELATVETARLLDRPPTTPSAGMPNMPGEGRGPAAIAEERGGRADREAAALVERENALWSRGTCHHRDRLGHDQEREAREALLALHAADGG